MSKKVFSCLLLSTLYSLLTVNRVWSACTGLYCHGGAVNVIWDQPLTGGECSACHSSFGAGNTLSWGPDIAKKIHQKHTSTNTAEGYGFACDQCHTRYGTGTKIAHAGGKGNPASGAAAEIKFYLANDLSPQTTKYGSNPVEMRYISLSTNPYTGGAVSPSPNYDYGASTKAADAAPGVGTGYFGISVGSCTNIWCHSNANPVGGSNQYVKVTSGPVTCTSCHAGPGTGGGTNLSLAHSTHTRTNTYNYKCYYCHEQTVVSESSYTIKYSSHHVNGIKGGDVDFSTHNPNGYYVDSATACYNTYCHSPGLTVWRTGASPSSTATWTDTGNCNYCHNGPPNGPGYKFSDVGKPNAHSKHTGTYKCNACHNWTANLVSGDNYTILYTTHHVNKVYTSTPSASYAFNYVFSSTPAASSCQNISCHNNTYALWSDTTPITCSDCHLAPVGQAERDDWVFGNNYLAKISSEQWYSSQHGSSITCTGDGTYSGCHIEYSTNVPHNTSGNFFRLAISTVTVLCRDCHVYRGVPESTQIISTHTHSEAVTGYHGTNDWGANSIAGGTSTKTYKCVDCHDPHGDGYSKMVSSKVYTGTSDREGKPNFNIAFGTRPVIFTLSIPAKATDYVYLSTANYPSDPTYGIFSNKICQVCHQGNAFHRSTWTVSHIGDPCISCHPHNEGFRGAGCNACHGGLTGASSENRSAYAPNNYWPDGSARTISTNLADRAGAHEKHVVAIAYRNGWTTPEQITAGANQKTICRYCHGGTIPPDGNDHYISNNEPEPATLPGDGVLTAGFKRLDTGATVDNGTYTYIGSGQERYCTNVDCHWKTRTPTPGGGSLGWYAADGSSQPAAATCGTCHRDTTINGSSWPAIGVHEKHARGSGGWETYGYACEKCHNSGSYGVKPANSNDLHNNNVWNLSFAGLGSAFTSTAAPSYLVSEIDKSSATIYTSTTGACSNLYCHGLQNTPQWNQTWADVYGAGVAASSKCAACHEKPPTTNAGSYAHTAHNLSNPNGLVGISTTSTVTEYRYGCGICHYETNQSTTTLSVSKHAQGRFTIGASSQAAEVSFATTVFTGGVYVPSTTVVARDNRGYEWTRGKCNSVYCHGVTLSSGTRVFSEPGVPASVSVSTPNWNVNLASATAGAQNIACGSCHNLFNSDSGSHKVHISTSTAATYTNVGYAFDCGRCHSWTDNSADNYLADISSRTYHVNKKTNVNFDTFNSNGNWGEP